MATAIKIGSPVSYEPRRRGDPRDQRRGRRRDGRRHPGRQAVIDRAGIGCEPASAATLAGVRQLVASGAIAPDARVVLILTGHMLKDSDTTVVYHLAADPPPTHRRPRPPGRRYRAWTLFIERWRLRMKESYLIAIQLYEEAVAAGAPRDVCHLCGAHVTEGVKGCWS